MEKALRITKALLLTFLYWFESIILLLIPNSWRSHKDISEDIAVITGGGSGIGRLLALRLADKGTKIVLWDIDRRGNDETAKLIKNIGGRVYTYTVDVSNRADVYAAAANVKDDVGTVTILVNNAGIVNGTNFLDTPDDKIVKTMDVNLMAHVWTMKAFLPGMRASNRGHVVTIASVAGYSGVNQLADYCCSKHGNIGLHESVALEMLADDKSGIDFTLICPYYINTGMFDGVDSSLVPVLEPDYVADEILTAILLRKPIVILPRYINALMILKSMVPVKSSQASWRASGLQNFMNGFKGRKKD